jgi:hypothetical protein
MLTHQSTTSSSIFPASTPSASGPTSTPSSPRSQEYFQGNGISSYDPEASNYREFDDDDVSYRLRLLVKNNYFLPPAHSKPSSSDLASSSLKPPKKSPRSTTPTFLDLFRVGRSKSKQPSPESSTESLLPILRTTSDSTTASGYAVRSPNPQSSPQTPSRSPLIQKAQERAVRVVVVREKMDDLKTAAKQAEQEMRAREGRRDRDQGSQRAQPNIIDDIDPTDAVDLPPMSDGYPFAVQASAIHGLGVQDSLGAAILAEQLPPLDPEEESWRRALLQEAIGHSLHSPNSSLSQSTSSYSTQNAVTAPSTPPSPTTSTNSSAMKHLIGQPILAQHILSRVNVDSALSAGPHNDPLNFKGRRRRILSSAESQSSAARPPSYLPRRAETPASFHPLAPPPRRHAPNQIYSRSQNDLPNADRSRNSSSSGLASSSKGLRKIMSSPGLSDSYESDVRPDMVMTPPPVPVVNISASSPKPLQSPGTVSSFSLHQRKGSTSASSRYSDDEEVEIENGPPRRSSMTLSIPTGGRPSMSEYSQPSPTASAFRDALDDYRYPSPRQSDEQRRSEEVIGPAPRLTSSSPAPRYSTMSPPPRVSSSLANVALSPPPRSSSLRHTSTYRPSTSDSQKSEEPMPPNPIAERRGRASIPTSLLIPIGHIPVAVQSAPPPSSPTSFFDLIEDSHSNAADEQDSSDESGVEDNYGGTEREDMSQTRTAAARMNASPSSFVNSRTRAMSNQMSADLKRPSFMRLGNNSTPHVSRSHTDSPSSVNSMDRRLPISNVPRQPSYFSRRKSGKSDQGHIPVSAFDFYMPTSAEPEVVQQREAVQDHSKRQRQSRQKAQESLRKLDGMLLQHMEAERDTIKRIASSVVTKT